MKIKTPFDEDIQNLQSEIKEIKEKLEVKEQQRKEYIIKNKLYMTFPLPEEYRKKHIKSLYFVDGKGDTSYECEDEIFVVDKNGYAYYSSYTYGILKYCKEEQCFVYHYYGNALKFNYVGCFDIELGDYDDYCYNKE